MYILAREYLSENMENLVFCHNYMNNKNHQTTCAL